MNIDLFLLQTIPIYIMYTRFFLILVFIITNSVYISCSSSDDSIVDDPGSSVNFENALLKTFPLSEVDPGSEERFSTEQPTLVNGVPQNKGKITIQISYTEVSKFSLKQVEFNSSDFSISPEVGEPSIIPNQIITYTITSTKDSSISLQYDVLVTIKEVNPGDEMLGITSFRFLKDNNSTLDKDINSFEIREENTVPHIRNARIAIVVPPGTDFSNLTPTINFKGSSLTYHTDTDGNDSDFKEFTNETSLDFKYPNIITFRIYNSNKSKSYTVPIYVDVKNPIVFDESRVTLNNGNTVSRDNLFDNVVEFTNQGNYPITASRINASEIKITETPEVNSVNYYRNISLRSGKIIHAGKKGRLVVQTNFPANFVGPGFPGIKEYIVNAKFETVLNVTNEEIDLLPFSIRSTDFHIYDPVDIEIIAKVFVFET